MRVDIHLLGGFSVVVDGRQVPPESWRRRHAAALVKVLALQPGRRMRREQVIDTLWPDLLLEEAAPRLHKAAFYGREALGVRSGVVLGDDAVVLLPGAEVTCDLLEFDAAADAAAGGNEEEASRAVDHYGGELLPDDLYEPWTEEPRERLRLRYLGLLRRLNRWEDIIATDPLDEEAHLELVAERIRSRDRQGALRLLDRLEQVFRRELGTGPSEDARALRKEALSLPALDPERERATTRPMTPVPLPPTRTVGREGDIERVLELLADSRVVTLLGTGGVGKTRLAIEAAHQYCAATGVGGCFIDLTKVADPDLVLELIASEMGVQTSGSTAEQTLREAMRSRSLLLVLDNFEHVIDAATLVARIVSWAPAVRLLVTSRARLRIDAEQVVDVAPLAVDGAELREHGPTPAEPPQAAALFAQVARAVHPSFELEQHLPDVIEICRQVDGLPLAIELAAGHVRTLSPTLLRTQLDTRLRSPEGSPRDWPPRQQTVAATIDWSLDLLGAAERALFARLGVFAGPVPLELIERVSEDGDEVVALLERLLDQSLVRRVAGPQEAPRFALLELLRERARAMLTEEEADALRDRHAATVAELLESLDERRGGDAAAGWIDEINGLLAEIRAAHAWAERRGEVRLAARIAASLGTFWHREGHHDEGRRWVTASLEHLADLPATVVADLQLAAGYLAWARDAEEGREHWRAAAELYRMLGDDRNLAYALALGCGTYIGDEHMYDEVLGVCDGAIDLARQVGDQALIAQALNVKGELARVHGDDELALQAYQEGLAAAVAIGDEAHVTVFLANLAYLAAHRREYDEAHRLGAEALTLCWRLGRRMMAAWTVSELASAEAGLGRPERGAVLVGAADEALRTLGVPRHPGDVGEHQRVVRSLRNALGDDEYDRLHAEGSELSLGDAVELALTDPAETATADRPEAPATSVGSPPQ